jgi:hypothetical protein
MANARIECLITIARCCNLGCALNHFALARLIGVAPIASLQPGPNNPVPTTRGNDRVDVNLLLAVALQLAPPEYLTDFTPQVWLNTPIMNLMRAGDQYPDRYDLQAIAEHELAEVLGIGGGGSSASDVLGERLPFDLDLFRYNAPGSRVFHGSYPPSGNGIAYFSIDGGVTNIINFNGTYSDGDGGDWFPTDGLEYVQNFNGTGLAHTVGSTSLFPSSRPSRWSAGI